MEGRTDGQNRGNFLPFLGWMDGRMELWWTDSHTKWHVEVGLHSLIIRQVLEELNYVKTEEGGSMAHGSCICVKETFKGFERQEKKNENRGVGDILDIDQK